VTDLSRAEEDLRVIRTLMERATVYRAISAPTALVGGLLSTLAAIAIHFDHKTDFLIYRTFGRRQFAIIWLLVLAGTLGANAFFVWREARKNGRPFISSAMQLALRAIAPQLLIPTAFTGWFLTTGYLGGAELTLVTVWIAFYGLALLSTALFAPSSLALLGWVFLLTSLGIPVALNFEGLPNNFPNLAMGVTFGLYHLIYAVCTWPRKRGETTDQLVHE
jgi:hypothetical protein